MLYLSLNLPTKRSSNKVESIPTAQVRRRRGSIQRILETFLKENEQETVEKKKKGENEEIINAKKFVSVGFKRVSIKKKKKRIKLERTIDIFYYAPIFFFLFFPLPRLFNFFNFFSK